MKPLLPVHCRVCNGFMIHARDGKARRDRCKPCIRAQVKEYHKEYAISRYHRLRSETSMKVKA